MNTPAKPYSSTAIIQPSEHPRWCVKAEAHSRQECATVTKERKQWTPIRKSDPWMFQCEHCDLKQREHINSLYCPEWRLRQMDGDR